MPTTKHEGGEVQPTPTQEENDLAMMGMHVDDKEPDGSPITDYGGDPQSAKYKGPVDNSRQHKAKETKESHAEQPARGGYQTRQATPQQTRPSHPPPLATSSSE